MNNSAFVYPPASPHSNIQNGRVIFLCWTGDEFQPRLPSLSDERGSSTAWDFWMWSTTRLVPKDV